MTRSLNYLVIGGAGFIGSALCRALIARGARRVASVDNYSTGTHANHIGRISYYHTAYANIEALVESIEADVIFHFGEYSRIATSFADFDQVMGSNVVGTANIIRTWVKTRCKLIYAGSSSIFSDPGLSPYSMSKANNARLINACAQWFNLPCSIVYFYNVYGPGQIDSGRMATVIGIFEKCLKEGRKLPVVLPGTQRRDFTHIDDVVKGLLLATDSGQGEYSLTTGETYSIFDLVEACDAEYEILPARPGERFNAVGNSERARNELGWRPTHNVIEYLQAVAREHGRMAGVR
jgi:UDP-glucose 4-epimerase